MIVVVSENTSAGFLLQIENEQGFDLAVFSFMNKTEVRW
jgi:hypothetical protein